MFDARQKSFHLIFWVLVVVGIALFFVPAFIIRPFRYQSPGALHLALVFRQLAPIGTILAACGVLGLAVWAWKSGRPSAEDTDGSGCFAGRSGRRRWRV